jgi:hypothetical protein
MVNANRKRKKIGFTGVFGEFLDNFSLVYRSMIDQTRYICQYDHGNRNEISVLSRFAQNRFCRT